MGEARAAELAGGQRRPDEPKGGQKLRIFEPMTGRAWKEYVQVDTGALTDAELQALAHEALGATAKMPAKAKKTRK